MLFADKLERWRGGDIGFAPVTLEIQPTERCNHRCPSCQAIYAISKKDVRRLAKAGGDLDFRLLDGVWRTPPDGIVISGNTGDPLMHPDIGELLMTAHRHDIPTALITNGEAFTESVARQAIECCRGIRISLDAHDASSFLMTHGVGEASWKSVLENIRMLVSVRSQSGVGREKCLIGVGYLTDHRTRNNMVDAARLAKSLGVDYIQFRPFHFKAEDIDAEINECVSLEEPPTFRVFDSRQKYARIRRPGRSYGSCQGASFYTVLDSHGDLYMCCHHVGRPEARLGSLRETSWTEWLESESRKAKIADFDLSGCIPLCRLHTHNERLERIRTGAETEMAADLSEEVKRHAVFL
ncbi:MAG: radical SAM protein [Patescibacteria group bacterium]